MSSRKDLANIGLFVILMYDCTSSVAQCTLDNLSYSILNSERVRQTILKTLFSVQL